MMARLIHRPKTSSFPTAPRRSWWRLKAVTRFRPIISHGRMRDMKSKRPTMSRSTGTGCKSLEGDCLVRWIQKNSRCWRMCVWTWFLLLNIGTWLGAPATYSAEASVPKESSPDPVTTTITSRTMTVSNQENKAIFDGSVALTRGRCQPEGASRYEEKRSAGPGRGADGFRPQHSHGRGHRPSQNREGRWARHVPKGSVLRRREEDRSHKI